IEPTERVESLFAGRDLASDLADDPGVHPARVLPVDRRSVWAVAEADPRGVAVVGQPVGLERDDRIGDHPTIEDPVEMDRVERRDDVVESDRPTTLNAGHEAKDARRRERIARFGD